MGAPINSEKKLQNPLYRLTLGTTNNINPIVVYIDGKTCISPKEEMDDYNVVIRAMRHDFSQTIREVLKTSNMFVDKYILDFNVAASGIAVGKKTYLSFQLLLKQKGEVLSLVDLKDIIPDTLQEMLDGLSNSIINHSFSMAKTKK